MSEAKVIGAPVGVLPEGLYRLTRDVDNRRVDKRYRRDWRCMPVFKAGECFIVTSWPTRRDDESFPMLRMRGCFGEVRLDEDDFAPVVLALERIEEMPTDYLDRKGWENMRGEILDWLFQEGKFTIEDIARVRAAREDVGE